MLSKREKQIISKIGYGKFYRIRKLGLTYEEYEKMQNEKKIRGKKRQVEKNKARYKTIRYIERYCNIERKCQICGNKAQIHHINYEDYLKINLLCIKHHNQLHKGKLKQPKIIDLEKIAVKTAYKTHNHKKMLENKIEEIKKDIVNNEKTLIDIVKQYHTSYTTIKKFLSEEEIKEIYRKSKENSIKRRKTKKMA